MVELQLAGRGISEPRVLDAFRAVPREAFVPPELAEFAYKDAPLPIGEDQTISQPYIVAVTIEALRLRGDERVLEIGTGSGYAAAVLSRIAKQVFTVERRASLANEARERLARLGYRNVDVLHGDGTLGWPEHAPYDAIAVAAGGPQVPKALLDQLAPGGRLVIPVGPDESSQVLTRVTRVGADDFREEPLIEVRFVPLIGEQGWPEEERVLLAPGKSSRNATVAKLIRETAEPIDDIESCSVDGLLERIGDARLVLLGEATHGTSEFYRMRARISKALIERRGFDFVAVEADWPDAARVDDYVLGDRPRSKLAFTPFSRFPTWMWRNEEVHDFVDWLRHRNLAQPERADRAGFHGLDLYSLFTSIAAVLAYLDDVDPEAARVARARYGALTPWQKDPAAYGRAVLAGRYESSETAVVAMLRDMLKRRLDYVRKDGERFFDAAQNARVVANAEQLLPRDVLRLGGLVEPPRRAHVRHAAGAAGVLRSRGEGDRLGAQLARRQRQRDRDEHPRRAQRRAALPRQVPRAGRTSSGSAPTTAPSRRRPTGTSRCSGCASAPPTRTATSVCSTTPTSRRSCSTCAIRNARRYARSCCPLVWSAPSGSCIGPRRSSRATTSTRACPTSSTSSSGSTRRRAVEPLAVAPRRSADLPETYPFGL